MPRIIRLDIHDVHKAGNVQQAIVTWCRANDVLCDAMRKEELDWDEFVLRSMKVAALPFVDALSGMIVRPEAVTEDTDPDDIHEDIKGDQFVLGKWSKYSVIELICPNDRNTMLYPEVSAHMAQLAVTQHSAKSNQMAWRKLIFWMSILVKAWANIPGVQYPS